MHIPNRAVFNSPCSLVQNAWSFLSDYQQFGGIEEAPHVRFFIVPCMRLSYVNQRFVLDCANSRPQTLLLLMMLLLLLLLLLLIPVAVCGSVASGTFVAGYVRCAITRKACVNGVHRFGFGVHPSHLPMRCWVLGMEADLEQL